LLREAIDISTYTERACTSAFTTIIQLYNSRQILFVRFCSRKSNSRATIKQISSGRIETFGRSREF